MSDLPRILQILVQLLDEHPRLSAAGVSVEATPPDAIVVLRGGETKGTWRRVDSALEWIPAGGTSGTHRVLTAEDAMLHTVSVLLRY